MNEAVLDFSEKSKYVREKTKDFTRILSSPVPALMIPDTLKRSLSIEIRNFSMKKSREKGFEVNRTADITLRTVKDVFNTDEVEVPALVYLTVRLIRFGI